MSQRARARTLLVAAVLILLLVLANAVTREKPGVAEPADPAAGEPVQSRAASPSVPEPAPPDPLAWADAEWTSVEGALAAGEGSGPLFRVDGLADTGGHLIAWGRVPVPGRNQFNDMGAVFVSADGRSWSAIALEHGVNALSASEISGVAAGPAGYLAFGGVCCDPEAPAIWHSLDLAHWTRLELDAGTEATFGPAVIVGGPDGWVAVGNSHDGTQGHIWTSGDGATWEPVLTVDQGMPLGQVMSDVAVTGDGLIAVGTVIDPDGTFDGAVWTSPDGRAWSRIAADDPALAGEGETRLLSVVPHAGGLYLTGEHGTTERRRECEQGGGPAATSCAWGLEHAWVSLDGRSWERVDPAKAAGERPIEFRLIAAGGPGLVLLGESSEPDSPDTTLFTSTDGRAWSPVRPPRPIGGGTPTALAVRSREVIAIADHSIGDGQRSWEVWLATIR